MGDVLEQDLTQREDHPGMIFIIYLLMEEKCEMPEKGFMQEVMEKHLGEVPCFTHGDDVAGFAPLKYSTHFEQEDKDVPPQLMIMGCSEIGDPILDELAASQLWDCPKGGEILETCRYQVVATDMLAAGLDYRERAEMLVDFIEALAEMFPSCKAFVFENSKKMFTRDDILGCTMPKESRFIHYAVNVRFFTIQGTDDMLVDTLGMSTLFLPDLQYHFHGLDPDDVVKHAYNFLSYIYDTGNPIESGDHIDGMQNGALSTEVQWQVRYEDSLIQPIREVIDVETGEFASGERV